MAPGVPATIPYGTSRAGRLRGTDESGGLLSGHSSKLIASGENGEGITWCRTR
jgi:hypothetical protein